MVELDSLIAPAFYSVHEDIMNGNHTHYWLSGGRGSTKSSFVSIEIILGVMSDKNANAVVLRKVKDNLRSSVYEQLLWAIESLGVAMLWEERVSPLELEYKPTGRKILFRGADKPKKIKSTKFKKGYCKYLWYEELDEFDGMEEVRSINQSLMRGGNDFKVFYSYNPPRTKQNWVNAEAKIERKDRLNHHSTYESVPVSWLGDPFLTEAEHLKATNRQAYEHEYLGISTGIDKLVFSNWQEFSFDVAALSKEKRFITLTGLDFGFVNDPTALICALCDTEKKELYIFDEYGETGLTNPEIAAVIQSLGYGKNIIMADSAEQKSIEEIRRAGIPRIKPCKKSPDSVLFGIQQLQQYKIYVLPKCRGVITELQNYSWVKDKQTGEYINKPVDQFNHFIDALRYSMQIIRGRMGTLPKGAL